VFTVVAQEGSEKSPVPAVGSLLDELVRDGALQMLAAALQAEVAAYIGQFADVLDEDGHRMVVRNGYHEQRDVATRAGAVTVTAPRVIGVRADGRKELVALTDGYRESTESWAGLLRDAKRRGMRAPVLAMGDSTLGFWAALRDVFPTTREQRCWFHKSENVLAALPKSAHPGVIKAMQEIYNAQDNDHARVAVKAFKIDYGTKFPKAVEKITCDLDVLLEFDNYPADHWLHLRTTNPIESTFATVRLRTKVTKGPGSRGAGFAMSFKLIKAAQGRGRAANAPHLVALVRAGATFLKGKLMERPVDQRAEIMVA